MSHHPGKTAGPIRPLFCTQIHLGPEIFLFFYWSGFWIGVGGEGEGSAVEGREGGRGRVGRGGKGLLNFHLIFQKTWAEPGNPS